MAGAMAAPQQRLQQQRLQQGRPAASCRPIQQLPRRPGRCITRQAPALPTGRGAEAPAAADGQQAPAPAAVAVGQQAPAPVAPPPWCWDDSDDALRAYTVFFAWLALGSLPQLQQLPLADLPYFIGLGVLTVYIGAHRGLTSRSKQQISIKEGLLAPVLASCSLFGLYLLIKFVPEFSLQAFLDLYFWLLGSAAITGAARPLLRGLGGPLARKSLRWAPPRGLLLDDDGGDVELVELSPADLMAAALGVGLATAELAGHHTSFTLNNMVACLVATEILALVGLRSFRTAALLLVGLLAYDVFWVFGSPQVVGDNVMLTVATSDMIVGPTRLLFPRAPGGIGEAADFPFSLLGLGDIAIPGLLCALALRFDASRVTNMQARAVAAAAAIGEALAALQPGASGREMAKAAADAADAAYDRVADRELRQRDSTQGGNRQAQAATAAAEQQQQQQWQEEQQQQQLPEEQQQQQPAGGVPVSSEVLQQRTYFTRTSVAHVAGLLSAFAANSVTHLGQPALLYIVPATLLTVLGTALSRSEVGRVWQFTDVPSFGLPAAAAAKAEPRE